jgi:DNA end-binding protein Ku
MIDPDSGDEVTYAETMKAYPVTRRELVILDDEELEKLEPKDSRDVEITRFVKTEEIDHRWYERPYYLGPDGDSEAYFAAAQALEEKDRQGIAKWVMRNKEYVGALRAEDGYLIMVALRFTDEIIDEEALPRPQGRALDKREVKMAEQLVSALEGNFDPTEFRDTYRDRVMDLIKTKQRGGKVKVAAFRPRKTGDEGLSRALQASLKATGTHGR